ncbi:MAG: rhomboid family intramembrane serine protease [Gammaproteobacteria bacterium]|nr:rhomboid family intramembrane serine protease [Gammaproteobacteria bacterium]
MIAALEIPSDIDLRLFSVFLQQAGVVHRITEEGVAQVVWINSEDDRLKVLHFYGQLSSGALVLQDQVGARSSDMSVVSRLLANVGRFPLTMLLLLVNVLLFPVTYGVNQGDLSGLFAQMTLLEFSVIGDKIYFSNLTHILESHQYWRLLTPMFIHFGWIHIVFNLLWVWEIGRRIELISGSSVLLLVTIVSSLGANFLQYAMSGAGLFGGMSGVVFGYLGHSLVWDKLVPGRKMGLRSGIYIFMLVFLAIGFTGAFDLLGLGSLANGAHLGGLLGGILTGGVAGMLQRFDRQET